ncbi:hypothetical protein VNO77_25851 [Canavalia gladiata]|uniref:Uncharacterized protein n=1 Tax=Canavalia gladiata TaxID=3824 RepID=A0AAN9KRC2_CANGL
MVLSDQVGSSVTQQTQWLLLSASNEKPNLSLNSKQSALSVRSCSPPNSSLWYISDPGPELNPKALINTSVIANHPIPNGQSSQYIKLLGPVPPNLYTVIDCKKVRILFLCLISAAVFVWVFYVKIPRKETLQNISVDESVSITDSSFEVYTANARGLAATLALLPPSLGYFLGYLLCPPPTHKNLSNTSHTTLTHSSP